MEAKEKMPGFRRWVLGDRRLVSDKCLLNSTLCTPRYTHELFLKDLSFQAAKDISASIRPQGTERVWAVVRETNPAFSRAWIS